MLYYAGTLFGLLGLSNPALGGLIPSITNTFFLLCGMVMVDRIGRRGLLMKFGPIMVIGLTWCLVSFYYMCKPTGGYLEEGYIYPNKLVAMVIAGIVIFVVGFGSTYAHLCWYQSEYLALEIRAAGSAVSTTASFSANLIVAVTFLTEFVSLTPWLQPLTNKFSDSRILRQLERMDFTFASSSSVLCWLTSAIPKQVSNTPYMCLHTY